MNCAHFAHRFKFRLFLLCWAVLLFHSSFSSRLLVFSATAVHVHFECLTFLIRCLVCYSRCVFVCFFFFMSIWFLCIISFSLCVCLSLSLCVYVSLYWHRSFTLLASSEPKPLTATVHTQQSKTEYRRAEPTINFNVDGRFMYARASIALNWRSFSPFENSNSQIRSRYNQPRRLFQLFDDFQKLTNPLCLLCVVYLIFVAIFFFAAHTLYLTHTQTHSIKSPVLFTIERARLCVCMWIKFNESKFKPSVNPWLVNP